MSKYFEVDETYSNVRVLRAFKERKLYLTEYEVRYLCCGHVGIIKHNTLRQRIIRKLDACCLCATRKYHDDKALDKPCTRASFSTMPLWAPIGDIDEC